MCSVRTWLVSLAKRGFLLHRLEPATEGWNRCELTGTTKGKCSKRGTKGCALLTRFGETGGGRAHASYSAARNSGYTFARAASFAGKALALAEGARQVLGPPRGPFREGRAAAPPRTLPRTVRCGGGLLSSLRSCTAQCPCPDPQWATRGTMNRLIHLTSSRLRPLPAQLPSDLMDSPSINPRPGSPPARIARPGPAGVSRPGPSRARPRGRGTPQWPTRSPPGSG